MPLNVTNVMILIARMLITPIQKIANQDLIHVSRELIVSSKDLLLWKTALLIFFRIGYEGVELTSRGCFANINGMFDDGECQEESNEGTKETLCVCMSDLCNGVEKMLPHFTMFLMTTLTSYYLM